MTSMRVQGVVRFHGMTPTLRSLFQSYWRLSSATLDGCMARIAAIAPQVLTASGASASWRLFQESSETTRAFVMSQPEMVRWINQLDRVVTLTPQSHEELQAHMQGLGRFTTAALLLDRREGDAVLPFDANGMCALPGCRAVIRGDSEYANRLLPCHTTSHSIRIGNADDPGALSCTIEQLTGDAPPPTWLHRSVESRGIGVYNEDTLLWETGGGNFVYEDMGAARQARWSAILDSSLGFVAAVLPPAYDEVVANIRVIIPVEPPVKNSHTSGTNAALPGAIYLSYSDDLYIMAECLVHEYGHNKLNVLLKTDPLVTNALARPFVYSPWKTEPRPLLGLLHGICAFQGVCQLWQAALERDVPDAPAPRRFVSQRFYQFLRQLQIALPDLRASGDITPAGASYLSEIESVVSGFEATVPRIPAEIREAVDRQVAAHEQQYRISEP